MFEAISEDIRPDRTADYAVVASFLVQARSNNPPPTTIRFIDGNSAESNLSGFVDATSPCELKQIYSVLRGGPDMPVFVEWSCPDPSPIFQAGFRIKNGQIERITFGPLRRVYIPNLGPNLGGR